MPDSNTVHMEVIQYQPAINKEIWSHDATTIEQCKQAFIDAPLFDGKKFWDAEQDIEWIDDKEKEVTRSINFQHFLFFVFITTFMNP